MFNRKAKTIQVAIEYRAPHWMVLIKNPGQKEWEPVRSLTKKVRVQDEFGTEVKSYPAIEAFGTMEVAEAWVIANIGEAKNIVTMRTTPVARAREDHEVDLGTNYRYTIA